MKWFIRFVVSNEMEQRNPDLRAFLECLRYAGKVSFRDEPCLNEDLLLIDVPISNEITAKMNVERIATFGFKAVVYKQ